MSQSHREPTEAPADGEPDRAFRAALESGSLDTAGLVDLIVRHVAEVVGEGSVVTVVSPDGQVVIPLAAHHPDPEVRAFMMSVLGRAPYRVSDGVVGSVVTTATPVVIGGIPAEATESLVSPPSRAFTAVHPVKAMMIVPLVDRGEVIGTLGVVRIASDEPYSAVELAVLEALGERVAGAVAGTRSQPRPLDQADAEAIFRHSLDGVLLTLPDGHVIAANPVACRILGLSEGEICALGRAGIVVNDDPRSRRAVEQRRLAGHARAEMPMRRGSGEVFVADVASTIFSGPDGQLRTITVFRDVTEEAARREAWDRQLEELERAAVTDELTGLWNRRGFAIAAQHACALADRQKVTIEILFLDVDGLKHVNDEFGHLVGDAVLASVGHAISHEVRSSDASARFGGDEFVMLLYDASREQATAVADRLVKRITRDDAIPEVGLSIGVSERAPGTDLTVDDLLRAADKRMYEEKMRHPHRGAQDGQRPSGTDEPSA